MYGWGCTAAACSNLQHMRTRACVLVHIYLSISIYISIYICTGWGREHSSSSSLGLAAHEDEGIYIYTGGGSTAAGACLALQHMKTRATSRSTQTCREIVFRVWIRIRMSYLTLIISLLSMLYTHMPWSEFPIDPSHPHYPLPSLHTGRG